jgi:RHS repeat-associated protein
VGNLTSVTDGNSNTTTHQYDALNRLFQTVDALNGVTGYGHDLNDQVNQVIAPLSAGTNATTQYEYDDLGNRLKETSPDRGTLSYTYDEAGNLLTVIDGRGMGVEYSYDTLNRPTDRYSWDEATDYFTYAYDSCGQGQLCNIYRNGSTHINLGYDAFGRRNYQLTFATDGSYLQTRYAYSAAGRLTQITYPNGMKINYVYNNLGQVQQVTALVGGVTTTLASNIVHQPFGPPSNWSYGNGNTYQAYFDTAYQLTLLSDGGYFVNNGYDGVGNLLSTGQKSFIYDPLDRLTQADDPQAGSYGSLSWLYDQNGNRLRETRNGVAQNYTYAAYTNWMYTAGGGDLRIPDAAGETQYMSSLGTLGYDGYGQLVDIGSRNTTYEYDAFGQRITKAVNGASTHFGYGPGGELLYENPPNGPRRCYVYLEGRPLALIDNESAFYYYHTDHLGTPQRITNSSRAVVWRASYEPFGKAGITTATITNNLRYPGMYSDSETGLYYWGARYYDPKTGRGISADPTNVVAHVRRWQENLGVPDQPPLEINPYAYVANNPLRWIDPDGLMGQGAGGGKSMPGPLRFGGGGAAPTEWGLPGSAGSPCGSGFKFPEFSYGAACRAHDRCYETCRANKTWCDFQFQWDAKQSCPAGDWRCQLLAQAYFEAVLHFGGGPYNRAQDEACKGGDCRK